jgi:hypothetical protein
MVIYGAFVLTSWHWQGLLVLAGWFLYFVRNMRRKDKSLSRHAEYAAYSQRTGMLLPAFGKGRVSSLSGSPMPEFRGSLKSSFEGGRAEWLREDFCIVIGSTPQRS